MVGIESKSVNSAIISVSHNAIIVFDHESLTSFPVAARVGVLTGHHSQEVCEVAIVQH